MAKKYYFQGKEIDQSTFDTLSQIDQLGKTGAITPTTGFNAAQNVLDEYNKKRALNEVSSKIGLASQFNQPQQTAVPVDSQTAPSGQDRGLLGNIVNGLVTSGGNLIQDLRAGYSGLAGALGVPGATEQGIKILSENERGKKLLNGTSNDAVKAGLNDFGFAASFVPAGGAFGTGIGALAKGGAVSGALAGLGQSKLDSAEGAITDVITGGVMGAGTGAALGLGSKALKGISNKITNKMKISEGTSITPEMKEAFPGLKGMTVAEEKAINPIKGGIEEMMTKSGGDQFEREGAAALIAKDVVKGVKDSANKDIIDSVVTAKGQARLLTRLGRKASEKVSGQIGKLPGEPVISGKELLSKMETDPAFASGSAQGVLETDIAKILLGKSKAAGFFGKTEFSLQDLYKLRGMFNDLSSTAAQKAASGSSGVAAGTQEANYAAANAIRDLMRNISKANPAIAEIENGFSLLHAYNNIAPGIFKSAVRPGAQWSVQSAVIGRLLPLGETAGRYGLSKAYGALGGISTSKLGTGATKAFDKASQGLEVGAGIAPRLYNVGSQESQQAPMDNSGGLGSSYADMGQGFAAPVQDTAGMLQTLIDGGYSPAEAKSLLGQITPSSSTAKMTDSGRKMNAAKSQILKSMDILRSGKVKIGPVTGALDEIGSDLGASDPTSNAYRASIGLARTQLQNSLIGAGMTSVEIQNLMGSMPNNGDTPQRALIKLNNMLDYIDAFMSSEAPQTTGIDINDLYKQ